MELSRWVLTLPPLRPTNQEMSFLTQGIRKNKSLALTTTVLKTQSRRTISFKQHSTEGEKRKNEREK